MRDEQILLAYWLGELDDAESAAAEEHFFGCAYCTRRLQWLAATGAGIRRATLDGRLQAVLTAPFIRALQEDGLRVREYHLQPGSSVACTIAADDDLAVSHLHAPLEEVRRLDLVLEDPASGMKLRLEDVAFDPALGEIVLLPSARQLRQLDSSSLHARLLAVNEGVDRELGSYTFNHFRCS